MKLSNVKISPRISNVPRSRNQFGDRSLTLSPVSAWLQGRQTLAGCAVAETYTADGIFAAVTMDVYARCIGLGLRLDLYSERTHTHYIHVYTTDVYTEDTDTQPAVTNALHERRARRHRVSVTRACRRWLTWHVDRPSMIIAAYSIPRSNGSRTFTPWSGHIPRPRISSRGQFASVTVNYRQLTWDKWAELRSFF